MTEGGQVCAAATDGEFTPRRLSVAGGSHSHGCSRRRFLLMRPSPRRLESTSEVQQSLYAISRPQKALPAVRHAVRKVNRFYEHIQQCEYFNNPFLLPQA